MTSAFSFRRKSSVPGKHGGFCFEAWFVGWSTLPAVIPLPHGLPVILLRFRCCDWPDTGSVGLYHPDAEGQPEVGGLPGGRPCLLAGFPADSSSRDTAGRFWWYAFGGGKRSGFVPTNPMLVTSKDIPFPYLLTLVLW